MTREAGAELLLVINGSPYEANKDDTRLDAGAPPRGPGRLRAGLPQPGRRPGRAGLRRRLASWSAPPARCSPAARSSSRPCWWSTSTCRGAPTTRPAAPEGVVHVDRCPTEPIAPLRRRSRRRRAGLDREARSTRRWCSGCATTSQERLPLGAARRLRRHRLHVVATIAADAIGGENVVGISNPSRYSAQHSRDDADELAARTGPGLPRRSRSSRWSARSWPTRAVRARRGEPPGARPRAGLDGAVQPGRPPRPRHQQQERAVGGYSTIYGDSVGGFAPIKDVPKTLVWELARWRNAEAVRRGEAPPIPENTDPQAAVGRAAPGPARPGLAAAVRRARRDPRRLRRAATRAAPSWWRPGFEPALVDQVLRLVDRAE